MSKRRKKEQSPRHKKYRPTIKVFCDGVTEEYYLQSIGDKIEHDTISFNIRSLPKRADQFNRVFEEIQSLLSDKKQYTLIFYILDMDTIYAQGKLQQYTEARDKCLHSRNANGRLFIIETMPCFEFWLLLHYDFVTKPFNCCDDVVRELKKHWPDYVKNSKCARQIYDKLQDSLDAAIERARSIEPVHSYSDMHIFFDELRSIVQIHST